MSCIQFIVGDLLQAGSVAVEEARLGGGPPRDDVSSPNEAGLALVFIGRPERGGGSLRSVCRDR
jgi:hypothetical protein